MRQLRPHPLRHLRISFDGASRGNPGPAAIGVVLEETGRVVEEVSERIGEATNNVAEYRALLKGLERARHLKAKTIDLRSDSELVVHQMNGRYKVRHDGLKPLWQEAQLAVAGFTRWTILHVPREQNRRADDLANAALDGEM